ncbi:MAG: hypothetical protein ABEI98_05665 [Halorhabdus sp.]
MDGEPTEPIQYRLVGGLVVGFVEVLAEIDPPPVIGFEDDDRSERLADLLVEEGRDAISGDHAVE